MGAQFISNEKIALYMYILKGQNKMQGFLFVSFR